jgi:hypothetical protein
MSWKRFVGLLCCVFLLTGIFLIACGGGGDDDGADGDIIILDEYQFRLSSPEGTIYAAFSEGSVGYTVEISTGAPGLQGTYNADTGEITLSGGSLVVNSDGGEPLFGEFSVQVAETITIPEGDYPTSGGIVVSLIGVGADTIWINMGLVVDLFYDEDSGDPKNPILGPVSYSWEAFEELLDSEEAEIWEQKASFSFGIIRFLLEQMGQVVEAFDLIDENENRLLSVNPVEEYCDAFSQFSLTPPGGVDDQGTAQFGWYDDLDDGEVGPGDSFSILFTDCWQNDEDDDIDELLQGGLDFSGYVENIELINDVETLTNIGFEEVEFTNLVIDETECDGEACTMEDGATTLTGTFTISFYSE